jgi:hypothetical protein
LVLVRLRGRRARRDSFLSFLLFDSDASLPLGDLSEETFRQELLAHKSGRLGAERTETAATMAEQIIAEELKRRGWKEAGLRTRPGGDAEKVALAARLRAATTMTVGWIADRLGMGSRGYLNHLLYRQRKPGGK